MASSGSTLHNEGLRTLRHKGLSSPELLGRHTMQTTLVPGSFVRHPQAPDWGLGQVQSVVGSRVTVNFEHRGKVLIDLRVVSLEPVGDSRAAPTPVRK